MTEMTDRGPSIPLPSHPLERITVDDFEWRAEIERLLIGPTDWAVRVSYRQRSTNGASSRRWVRFMLVPEAGKSFEETARSLELAIIAHFRHEAGV